MLHDRFKKCSISKRRVFRVRKFRHFKAKASTESLQLERKKYDKDYKLVKGTERYSVTERERTI